MSTAPLPVVRLRLPCADAQEYRRARAREYEARGVFVPSARARPVGTRVRLKIELRDRSLGHDGEAIVVRHVATGPRPGYVLRLAAPEEGRGSASQGAPVPAAAPAPPPAAAVATAAAAPAAPVPAPAPAPVAERRDSASLAEFLFADLGPADSAPDLGASGPAAAPAVAPSRPTSPSRPPPSLASPAASTRVLAWREPAAESEAEEELATSCTPPPEAMADPGERPAPARAPTGVRAFARRLQGVGGYRRAAPILAAVLLSGAVGGETLHLADGRRRAEARAAELVTELRRADDRLRSGRLAVPAQDSALDHLVAARALGPEDPRVTTRLALLAGLLGDLGERALARGDLEEAAAHLRAAVRADPGDEAARRRLGALADRAAAPPRG